MDRAALGDLCQAPLLRLVVATYRRLIVNSPPPQVIVDLARNDAFVGLRRLAQGEPVTVDSRRFRERLWVHKNR